MDILLLGTAAAEGWPALFCDCNACRRARAAGGKNIRSRASIMIGKHHKIDFPPDGFYHEAIIGADFSKLRHLFFTHTHQDHFDIDELAFLCPPFAHDNEPVLYIWGSSQAVDKITTAHQNRFARVNIEANSMEAFKSVTIDGLTFTPVLARHKQDEECFNYIVGDGNKSFLYTCDTGPYEEPTWEYLSSVKLDLLVSECTNGPHIRSTGHMSVPDVLEMIERLKGYGTMSETSRVVLTHFSHNGQLLHEELEELVRPYGIEVGFDGMRIEV